MLQRATFPLQVQICYLRRLSCAFGWRYVAAVTSVYGISQGVGEVYYDFAFDFFAADDLKISPARAAELYGLGHTPWELKALFGMMSDAWPICGYRRAPYVVIFGVLGTIGWLSVGASTVTSVGWVAMLLMLGNLSQAGPDVMIDATNAERVISHPPLASDIQSLSWGMFGAWGVLAGLSQGPLQAFAGARGVFLACSLVCTYTHPSL
jgi:hypothetical protein